jgi:hypothetical protein
MTFLAKSTQTRAALPMGILVPLGGRRLTLQYADLGTRCRTLESGNSLRSGRLLWMIAKKGLRALFRARRVMAVIAVRGEQRLGLRLHVAWIRLGHHYRLTPHAVAFDQVLRISADTAKRRLIRCLGWVAA